MYEVWLVGWLVAKPWDLGGAGSHENQFNLQFVPACHAPG